MNLTKEEKRVIFDPEKIGVGDVIKVPLNLWNKKGFSWGFKPTQFEVAGVLKEVNATELILHVVDQQGDQYDFVVDIEKAEHITILWKAIW